MESPVKMQKLSSEADKENIEARYEADEVAVPIKGIPELPDEPEKRSLKASPPELVAFLIAVLPALDDVLIPEAVLGGCWPATYAGVFDRVLDGELAAASIENTSFCGFRWPEAAGEMAPSVRGGAAGFEGAVEFQRSANESDIVCTVDQLQ